MNQFVAEVHPEAPHVLMLSGELDLAAVDRFLEPARAALRDAGTELEIDFADVTFIDSTGLGALVRLREEATGAGKSVRISHPGRQVVRILELTGLSEVFLDQPGG